MAIICKCIFWVSSALIIWEDFRYRQYHMAWYILLAFAMGTYISLYEHMEAIWKTTVWNLLFIGANLLVVQLYFFWRSNSLSLVIDRMLGLGDVMIWLLLAFLFDPLDFLQFFLVTIMSSLLVVALSRGIKPGLFITVPLAGFQVIGLLLLEIGRFAGLSFFESYKL